MICKNKVKTPSSNFKDTSKNRKFKFLSLKAEYLNQYMQFYYDDNSRELIWN